LMVNVDVRTGGYETKTGVSSDASPSDLGYDPKEYFGLDPSFVGVPTVSQFPVWNLDVQLWADYEASRQRIETVKFSAFADVQQVVTENADPFLTMNVTSGEVDQPIDPDGAIPLYDLRRDSYLLTDRGKRSLRYLIATARSRLLARARNVTISLEDKFENVVPVSLRKSASISDPRVPGGIAEGKITSYTLSFDGDGGEMLGSVTIGCAIGNGNDLTLPVSTETYVDAGVLDAGVQSVTSGGTLVSDIYYGDFDTTPIATDGVDLLNPDAATMVDSIEVVNGF
jgi:hypothetical protein